MPAATVAARPALLISFLATLVRHLGLEQRGGFDPGVATEGAAMDIGHMRQVHEVVYDELVVRWDEIGGLPGAAVTL